MDASTYKDLGIRVNQNPIIHAILTFMFIKAEYPHRHLLTWPTKKIITINFGEVAF